MAAHHFSASPTSNYSRLPYASVCEIFGVTKFQTGKWRMNSDQRAANAGPENEGTNVGAGRCRTVKCKTGI